MKKLLLLAALFATIQILTAQTWTPTSAGTNNWRCIASSADGTRLFAGLWPGSIYVSTNSGATWAPTTAPNESWASLASSEDGTKLLASCGEGIYTSTDGGNTWVSNSVPQAYWGSVASSADGSKLFAVAIWGTSVGVGGMICYSTNAGASWTTNGLNEAVGVASSTDGSKVVAVTGLQLWRSTNFGTTWAQDTDAPSVGAFVSPSQYIASSADGSKLILGVSQVGESSPAPIYISTNSGDTWNLTSAPSNFWTYVASSADGRTLLATSGGLLTGALYLSTNFGATWTSNSPNMCWSGVASSADGGKLSAVAYGDSNLAYASGAIFTAQLIQPPSINIAPANGNLLLSWLVPSTNFVLQQSLDLVSWTDITNAPVLNLANLQNQVNLPVTKNIGFYRLRMP